MINSRWKCGTSIAVVLAMSLVLLTGPAGADPASDLSGAESRAASAEAEVAAAQRRLDAARSDYAASSRRAGPVAEEAKAARANARELRDRLVDRQRNARAEIALVEASQQQEEEDHDDEVTMGIGMGLALLVAAAIALGWAWFRASAAVSSLASIRLGQAIGLCLGGGFLVVVIGAVLAEGDGVVAVLGTLLACLGFILPVALLLARHSVEVQRGGAKPIFRRERLPNWVPRGSAALLLLFGLVFLIGGIATDEAESPAVAERLREDAEPIESGPGAAELEEATAEATAAEEQAAGPLAQQRAAGAAVRTAGRTMRRAESRLVSAEADARRFSRQLAVLYEREEREAAKAEREAEAQAEREAEEYEAEEAEFEEFEEEGGGGCDPNYSGCVPAYPPDVDCAEVGGSVSSYGTDPHGLDADSDGIGCE